MVVGGSVVVGGGAPVVVVVGGSVVVVVGAPGAVVPGAVVPGAVVPGAPGTAVVTGRPANPPPGDSATEVDGPGVNEPAPLRGAGRPGNVSPPGEVVVTARIDVVDDTTVLPRNDSDVDVVTRRAASTSAASVTRWARANFAISSARADEAKPPIMAT